MASAMTAAASVLRNGASPGPPADLDPSATAASSKFQKVDTPVDSPSPDAALTSSCAHVRSYVAKHPTMTDVVTIRNYALASLNPASNIPPPRCFDCSSFCHRLHACLECIYVGCFVGGHMHDHANAKGHHLAIDLRRLELYCFACKDAVYDADFDLAVCKSDVQATPDGDAPPKSGQAGVKRRTPPTVEAQNKLAKYHFKVLEDTTGYLGLRGMINLGNTCFMSVVLQAMVNNPLLRNFFLSDGHNRHLCKKQSSVSSSTAKTCLGCNMDQVFEKAFSGETTPYAPHEFLCSMWSHADHLAGYEQQDAHEFVIALLDGIHSSCEGSHKDCSCIVHSVFAGELQSNVTCTKCRSVSTAVDPIFDIALDLKNADNSASNIPQTLFDCLERFTHPEKLADKFFCRKCNSHQTSVKQFLIRTLPPVLCFHVKRFKHHGHVAKLSSKVGSYLQFPMDDLDISRFVASSDSKDIDESRAYDDYGSPRRRKPCEHLYNLFAVVEHAGSLENGHYIAYIRRGMRWFKCDDAMVREATEREVIRSQCYMLFYMRSG